MNIVLVVFDSLRQDHVGAYGNDWIQTPNLDQFASESIRFTKCYPETLPTLPMRRGLYTGQRIFPYPEIAGPFKPLYHMPGWGPILPERKTISESLQQDGYRTCLVADLWHFFKSNRNFQRGFSSYEFIRGQEMDSYRTGPPLDDDFLESFIPKSHKKNDKVKAFLGRYLQNNYFLHEEERSTSQIFRKAARWIEDNQDAEKFFMVLESFDPHEPWLPPSRYRKLYDPDDDCPVNCIQPPYMKWQEFLSPRELKRLQANYAGSVTWLDRWFGYFMDALKYSGRLQDTLVVVLTDHGHNIGHKGDQDYVGKQGHPSTHGNNDLVLMMRHPKGEGAGAVSDLLCQQFDLTRTLYDFAQVEPPENVEGLNIWQPALAGKPLREYASTVWGTVATVVTEKWWGNGSLYGHGHRLFDNVNDFYHTKDLAEEHPDVCPDLIKRLIEDSGGWDNIPANLSDYKERVGCGVGGYAPMAYSNAIYIDAATM